MLIKNPAIKNSAIKISAFWWFAVPYCFAWALLCFFFQTTYRSDTLEQLFLGDQWILSSLKHPMLSGWYMNFFRVLTFDSALAPYLTAEACVLLILWAVWQLSRECLHDDRLALLAVVATANFRYLNIGNLVYNHNTVMLVFWALTILSLYKALSGHGQRHWILTGIWIGLGLLGKYAFLELVIAILVFMVGHPQARKFWKTPWPYLTTLVAALIFLPHAIWVIQTDWCTIDFALHSRHQTAAADLSLLQRVGKHAVFSITLFAGLFLVLLPSLISVYPLVGPIWAWRARPEAFADKRERWNVAFLGTMIAIPLAFHFMLALSGADLGTSDNMTIGVFVPLLVLLLVSRTQTPDAVLRSLGLGMMIAVLIMGIWAGHLTYTARYGEKPSMICFPATLLANQAEQCWADQFGDVPCPFVTEVSSGINTYQLSGFVHVYGKKKIPVHAKDVTPNSTDGTVNRNGGLLLWDKRSMEDGFAQAKERFPLAKQLPDLVIPYPKPFSARFQPENIGIAVVPPGS